MKVAPVSQQVWRRLPKCMYLSEVFGSRKQKKRIWRGFGGASRSLFDIAARPSTTVTGTVIDLR
ncbi:MAG TPA: hypothetical protein VNX26_02510 [Candidatus Acidoferrum sp.]|nr:hypothetical protein [Candidatus Acidoferrum sp.]